MVGKKKRGPILSRQRTVEIRKEKQLEEDVVSNELSLPPQGLWDKQWEEVCAP